MSALFRDASAGWTALLVIALPLVIIGIGEIEERLRQRDSPLRRPASILRTWVVPLFAVWALLLVVFDPGDDNLVLQLVASALVIAVGAAVLSALEIVVGGLRDRPRTEGQRALPRLVLAVPRLAALLTIAWVLIAGVWQIDLSAALTALGVTSLIVSFALQDTLGGLASGFTLLADQPFQPGDWIRTGDLEGRVVDVNWRSSRIQTRDGDLVVVPNGQLATATITNYDEPARVHRVVVPLQVAYSNAPTSAKEMLLAAARATPGVLADPPPNVRVVQIDDPLMGYEVDMWVDDFAIVPAVRSEFGSLVWYHSHRYGVPLPSPAQDLYLWDGERTAAQGVPDHAARLAALRTSPLLDQLPDDELDRLADAAEPARFARGELILGESAAAPIVLRRGTARLMLRRPGFADVAVLDLEAGDVFGVTEQDDDQRRRQIVVAVSDCDVVLLRSDVAASVISRSPALTGALEQLGTSRRRRVQRVLRQLADAGEVVPQPIEATAVERPADTDITDTTDPGITETTDTDITDTDITDTTDTDATDGDTDVTDTTDTDATGAPGGDER